MGKKNLKLNALVEILSRNNPAQLEKLRQRYPEQEELLTPGQMLGELEFDDLAVAELAISALDILKVRIEANLNRLRRQLSRAKDIRLVSNIINTFSSAGIISAILGNNPTFAIITAFVTFISSVSLLISQHLESSFLGNENSPQKLFDNLVQVIPNAADLEFKLKVAMKTGVENEKLIDLAQQANALVASVRKIEAIIGNSV
jgi:hypothetical protein